MFGQHLHFKKEKDMSAFIKSEITLTWSKIVALVMLILAFILDLKFTKGGTVTMFTIPFAVGLITGKQINDRLSKKKDEKIHVNK